MYQDELEKIWQQQRRYFSHLPDDFMLDNKGIRKIIFYQRPLRHKKDRVGKCSLEHKNNRASMARLEVQRFRYLQDLNNLKYFERHTNQWISIYKKDKKELKDYFEHHAKTKLTGIKKILGVDGKTKLNLEAKNLKGNITSCEIRMVLDKLWDNYSDKTQQELVEDLLSIRKKSALKARLLSHLKFNKIQAVKLCLSEFEPSHSSHSLKAINKLLPYLEQGLRYDEARVKAGYGYEVKQITPQEKLTTPPATSNPIVNRGLHELKLVINASQHFEKAGNHNVLTDDHVMRIVETYAKRGNIDKYAYKASLSEIRENNYNLNIPRYVDTFEEEPVDINTVATELAALEK